MFAWSSVCGDRPAVMGIVNVTPDSFSDGGRFLDPDAAVAHGLALVAAGADLLDVGGESTRPGAEPVGGGRRAAPGAAGRRAGSPPRRACRSASTPRKAGGRRRRARRRCDHRERRLRRRPTPTCSRSWPRRGAGFVVDAHAGRAAHDAGRPALRRRRRRGRRLPRRPPRTPRRAAGIDAGALCADPGHRLRQDRPRTTSTLLARLDELVARVDVPVLVGTSRKSFIRPVARRRSTLADDATTARSPRRCGRSTTARGSCGCTTPRAAARRAAVARRSMCGDSTPRRSREGSLGPGARAARVLLDHQGPARRVGAPRRLRAQPPQGAAPGGADLADRPRLHAHPLDARLAAQPARVRGSRRSRTRTCRSGATTSGVERLPVLYATLAALARRPARSGCSSTTRSSATACSACSPGTCSTPASSPRARTRWSSIEKITGRQLGSVAREIVAVTVDEGIVEPVPLPRRRARS